MYVADLQLSLETITSQLYLLQVRDLLKEGSLELEPKKQEVKWSKRSELEV